MLLITFHGGAAGENNAHIYGTNAELISDRAFHKPSDGGDLYELRGVFLHNDGIYVCNANRKESRILKYFSALDDHSRYKCLGTFISPAHSSALAHPFAICFVGDRCFISCQDSNTVISFTSNGGVAKHPNSLKQYPNLLPGTFVASSHPNLPGVPPTTAVARPIGLSAELDDKKQVRHSVRGIAAFDTTLFVADQAADAVKGYDMQSGELKQTIEHSALEKPVHLLVNNDVLFIGSSGNGKILKGKVISGTCGDLVEAAEGISHLSGLASVGGTLYIGSRDECTIYRVLPSSRKPEVFIKHLPDAPEFVIALNKS